MKKEQAQKILDILNSASESDFVVVGNGTSQYITNITDIADEYDYEEETELDFLINSELDDVWDIGIYVIPEESDFEYSEDEYISIQDLLKYGCHFYKKQLVAEYK